MHDLVSILVPLGCGCVLPIMIVWFTIRESMNKTNQRTQIVLAAIEKNPDMDIEELMKKISPKPKLLKEKLPRCHYPGEPGVVSREREMCLSHQP